MGAKLDRADQRELTPGRGFQLSRVAWVLDPDGIPDGVFAHDDDGTARFHRLPPPSDEDVELLLARIAGRVLALIVDDDSDAGDDGDLQLWAQADASQPPLFHVPLDADERKRPRCAFVDGFSLHADVSVEADRRKKLERLLRYGLRPPFAGRRLSLRRRFKSDPLSAFCVIHFRRGNERDLAAGL